VSDAALVVALKDEVDSSARKLASLATNLITSQVGQQPGQAIRMDIAVESLFFNGHNSLVADFIRATIAHSHLRARYAAALASLPTTPR